MSGLAQDSSRRHARSAGPARPLRGGQVSGVEFASLSAKEAAQWLGIDRAKLDRLVRRGDLIPLDANPPDGLRFSTADLESFCLQQEHRVSRAGRHGSRVAALNEAWGALSADYDVDSVFQHVVDEARNLVDAAHALLGVVDADGVVSQFFTSGFTPQQRRSISARAYCRTLFHLLLRERRSVRVADIQDVRGAAELPPSHPRVGPLLGVPIAERHRILGGLCLVGKRNGGRFTAADERLISMLSRHAAIAIENAHLSAQLRQRMSQLTSLRSVSAAIAGELDLRSVLDLVTEECRELTHAAGASIALTDERARALRYTATVGSDVAFVERFTFPLDDSISGWVLQRGQSVRIDNTAEDPRIKPEVARQLGARSMILVPLATRGKPIGTLAALGRAGERSFTTEDVTLLEALGHQAAIAVRNALLFQQAQRVAVLEERERIARDLHDGISDTIYAAGLGVGHASEILAESPTEARSHLGQAVRALDRAMADIRDYVIGLQSSEPQPPLRERLEQLGALFDSPRSVRVRVDVSPDADQIVGDQAVLHVVQIAREALANAIRHGQAARVAITDQRTGNTWRLVIVDDGCGFDPDLAQGSRHRGLRNMRERARSVRGRLSIRSAPGQGTCVSLDLPIGPNASPRSG